MTGPIWWRVPSCDPPFDWKPRIIKKSTFQTIQSPNLLQMGRWVQKGMSGQTITFHQPRYPSNQVMFFFLSYFFVVWSLQCDQVCDVCVCIYLLKYFLGPLGGYNIGTVVGRHFLKSPLSRYICYIITRTLHIPNHYSLRSFRISCCSGCSRHLVWVYFGVPTI